MSDEAIHFILFQDCLIRVPNDAMLPKFGSFLLTRNHPLQEGEVVLELGAEAGLIGIVAASRGHRVMATDMAPGRSE